MKAADLVTVAVVAAGAFGVYAAWKRGGGTLGNDIGAGAVDLADGLFGGAINRIGDKVGVPRTDAERGRQEWESGNYYEASKYMPAVDFIGAVWGAMTGGGATGSGVQVGGSSVQERHTTDLPEGSYRAAEMYWSLYPNAVFYD